MADARVRITKRLVDTLVTDGTDRTIRDSDVLGFAVRITSAGHITYILRYWFEGRQRKYRIGVHGSPWTPETARAEAQVLPGKVADGVDPQQKKSQNEKNRR